MGRYFGGNTSGSSPKQTPLYVGGCTYAGEAYARTSWSYARGVYRNLAIYNVALTDAQIANFTFGS